MTFLETALVALLAPAGAVGLWLFQKGERHAERTDARKESYREIRRAKAEEVFQELHRVKSAYGERVTYALSRIANKQVEPRWDTATGRLDALLSIYFPERLSLLEAFEEDVQRMLKNGAAVLLEEIKKGASKEKQDQINLVLSNELNKRMGEFAFALRTAMREEIADMWDPGAAVERAKVEAAVTPSGPKTAAAAEGAPLIETPSDR